jgi:hypothetical protein
MEKTNDFYYLLNIPTGKVIEFNNIKLIDHDKNIYKGIT